MAIGRIILSSITWSAPLPDTYNQVSVAYRLTDDPDIDASYTIVGIGFFVSQLGFFLSPVIIDGLDTLLSYTVKVTSLCGDFSVEQEFTYLPPAAFSVGFSLGFQS